VCAVQCSVCAQRASVWLLLARAWLFRRLPFRRKVRHLPFRRRFWSRHDVWRAGRYLQSLFIACPARQAQEYAFSGAAWFAASAANDSSTHCHWPVLCFAGRIFFTMASNPQMTGMEYPIILTDGGDDRLTLNSKGVNKYHCKPEVINLSPTHLLGCAAAVSRRPRVETRATQEWHAH